MKQIISMKKVRIAITGGIGSGKSVVAKYVASLGYSVFSCDEIYKNIYQTEDFQKRLLREFPSCEVNGRIDKKLLSSYIFSEEAARMRLNQISHKEVFLELERLINSVDQNLLFVEVPLLFEGGYQNQFDYVWVVLRDIEQRISSIVARDNVSKEDALLRISAQWNYDKNCALFKGGKYFLIENSGNIVDLHEKIKNLLNDIYETISVKQ